MHDLGMDGAQLLQLTIDRYFNKLLHTTTSFHHHHQNRQLRPSCNFGQLAPAHGQRCLDLFYQLHDLDINTTEHHQLTIHPYSNKQPHTAASFHQNHQNSQLQKFCFGPCTQNNSLPFRNHCSHDHPTNFPTRP